MKPTPGKMAKWESAIQQVKQGMTRAEAETVLGAPSRTVSSGDMEIVAYQLEQIGNALYSIRVAYNGDRVAQCYLGYELCEGDCRPASQKKSERWQLLLVVVIGAIVILVYGWLKLR